MNDYFDQYIESEYSRMSLTADTCELEAGMMIRTLIYEIQNSEDYVVLRDMVKECLDRLHTPVVVLNFENELGFDGSEDMFLKQLLDQGVRVVYAKCSYYETKDNAQGFMMNGIAYWKKNMAAQQVCMDYLKKNKYMEDISFVAMNGLSACTLGTVAANHVKCNQLFLINGVLDFRFIFEQGLWNLIFAEGYYHFSTDVKEFPVDQNPELEALNPYSLLKQVDAHKIRLFSLDILFDDDEIEPIMCENRNEIFDRILHEV